MSAAPQQPSANKYTPARVRLCFGFALLFTVLAALTAQASAESGATTPPKPLREFRGAWVATVANIDWPSKKGLSTAEQKSEMVALLDRAAQLKLNAIIFQVRPACDAMYASTIEPWSEYLTGTMGQPPAPFYDPLSFAVAEAHKRGLELHAWFNPYRARQAAAKSPSSGNHISKTHPQLVRQYGKSLWLDPGEKEVQKYSLSVVMDVVKRYDIDGVHFDDYFYPYAETNGLGEDIEFPDETSWKRFGAGGRLSRDDWRRENVNTFIEQVYKSIKSAKPWVKFGISPFGIWRPEYPEQIQGYDAYAKLYADSRKWLTKGWLDYFAPQLYWAIDPPDQSFPVLLKWWAEQNRKNRHLWPGLNTYNTNEKWKPEEIVQQIRLTRKQPGADGHIHWNMKTLMRNAGLDAALEHEVYAQPALVPAAPWLSSRRPGTPKLTVKKTGSGSGLIADWAPAAKDQPWLWVLQTRSGRDEWTTEILPAAQTSEAWNSSRLEVVALSAVDRYGNICVPAAVKVER
jgi:uncharacterized lipoprotein YddW (UPF0748 family)